MYRGSMTDVNRLVGNDDDSNAAIIELTHQMIAVTGSKLLVADFDYTGQ